MNILAGSDRSTTLLKFLDHANLSTAGAEWSQSQSLRLGCAWVGPSTMFEDPSAQPTISDTVQLLCS